MGWSEFWTGRAPYPLVRRVIVHTKGNLSFEGVLWQRRAGYLVLRKAAQREPGRNPNPVDGELVLDEREVAFMQVFGEATL
jgi:hypothetical protein